MARRLQLNLATEPFRRDRPMIVASSAVAVALTALLGVLIYTVLAQRTDVADSREMVSRLERQAQAIAAEQAKLEGVLRLPANADVLERSLLLNTLLQRKGISWTKIFSDLESVMPHNVRLVSIRPEVNSENRIFLQMVVGAQTSEPVLHFLMAMESSPLFGPTSLHSFLPPSQNEPLYRYRLSVSYGRKL
jgi:type IV pilus assembly protein PilN